jgi:hypothetical protein
MPKLQIPIPPPPRGSRKISDWGKWILDIFLLGSGQTFANEAGVAVDKWVTKLLGIDPIAAPPSRDPILDYLADIEGIPPEVVASIQEASAKGDSSRVMLGVLYATLGVMGMIAGPTSIVGKVAGYTVDKTYRSARPNPAELMAMLRRDPADAASISEYLRETGWPDDLIDGWEKITRPLLDNADLASGYLRGFMTEAEFHAQLRKKGYDDADTQVIEQLVQIIPGPQDLIRMAVREAWNENVVRTFGYDADFPAEFGEWTEKQGLSAEWAQRYWRAHWNLPSVQLGYEMLHRQVMSEGDLKLLLQAQDIPPYWRDKLIEISYNPYTRVDVRRMYELGVLDETALTKAYRDAGYNAERADKLTEWTIKEYGHGQENKMANTVLSAFQKGTITEAEARAYLTDLEIPAFQQDSDIQMALLRRQTTYEGAVLRAIRTAFIGWEIDEGKARDKLAALNPPAGFINDQIALWDITRQQRLKKLTAKEIQKFWLNGVMDESEVDREMLRIGYNQERSNWFKTLWLFEMLEAEEA